MRYKDKLFCVNGHKLDEENVYWQLRKAYKGRKPYWTRVCRKCKALTDKTWETYKRTSPKNRSK